VALEAAAQFGGGQVLALETGRPPLVRLVHLELGHVSGEHQLHMRAEFAGAEGVGDDRGLGGGAGVDDDHVFGEFQLIGGHDLRRAVGGAQGVHHFQFDFAVGQTGVFLRQRAHPLVKRRGAVDGDDPFHWFLPGCWFAFPAVCYCLFALS